MAQRIDSIYCFDYTHKIGHYDSIRDFGSVEMRYIGVALSTPQIHVDATPNSFNISSSGSSAIREYAISQLDALQEISENLAINSPKYFYIKYFDGSERYFAYNDSFYFLFEIAFQYKPKEAVKDEYVSPYAIQENPPTYVKPHQPQVQVQSTQPQTTVHKNNVQKQENSSIPWWSVFTFILLIIGMLGLLVNCSSVNVNNSGSPTTATTPKNELNPISEPLNGTILYGERLEEGAQLTINASSSESCIVKLKSPEKTTLYCFYVRAGQTATFIVPSKSMYVYFASGETWYGALYLYGENTRYSMDDELIDFTPNTSLTYTLYPVTNGNFQVTPIDPKDF